MLPFSVGQDHLCHRLIKGCIIYQKDLKIPAVMQDARVLMTKQNLNTSFWLLVLQFSGSTIFLALAFSYWYRKGLAAIEQEICCSGLNWSVWNLTDSCVIKAVPGLGHWILAESSVVAAIQITKVVLGEKGMSDLVFTCQYSLTIGTKKVGPRDIFHNCPLY